MDHAYIYYTLWTLVTIGMLWSIRDQNAKTHAILNHIAEIARDMAQFLGTDRR
jgi:hypothetical protein